MKYPMNQKLFTVDEQTKYTDYKNLTFKAFAENQNLAVENVFFTGDRRHGRSLSRLMNAGIDALCTAAPHIINLTAQLIPEYGDWDNLLVLMHHEKTRGEALRLFLGRINADINLVEERRPSSSFALCMPDSHTEEGKMLADAFQLSFDSYDALLSSLKEKADVPSYHTDYVMSGDMEQTLEKYKRVIALIHEEEEN